MDAVVIAVCIIVIGIHHINIKGNTAAVAAQDRQVIGAYAVKRFAFVNRETVAIGHKHSHLVFLGGHPGFAVMIAEDDGKRDIPLD